MPPIPPVVGMCRRHTKEQQCGNTTNVAPCMLIDVQGARKVPVRCIQTWARTTWSHPDLLFATWNSTL